jgi:hypothetical protein
MSVVVVLHQLLFLLDQVRLAQAVEVLLVFLDRPHH